MELGPLVLPAFALAWPAGAAFVVLLRRDAQRWRPFAWAAGLALGVAVVAAVGGELNHRIRGGTTAAMTGLGVQLFAAACLVGGALSGLVAGVARRYEGGHRDR